jgi:hypothetical protein
MVDCKLSYYGYLPIILNAENSKGILSLPVYDCSILLLRSSIDMDRTLEHITTIGSNKKQGKTFSIGKIPRLMFPQY